jgi:hypothetical protein
VRVVSWCVLVAFCLGASSHARAEIGNPTHPGGVYLSIEGGYQGSTAPGVAADGDSTVTPGQPSPLSGGSGSASGTTASSASASAGNGFASGTASAVGAPFTVSALANSGTESASGNPDGGRFIDADSGPYGAMSLGYALQSPTQGFLTRIEFYASVSSAESSSESFGALGLRGVDNNSAVVFAAVPLSDVGVNVTQTVRTQEVGFRFKTDQQAGPVAAALSVEPFFMHYDQSTATIGTFNDPMSGSASASRNSDVSADIYGAQIAAEGVLPVVGNISLIGRGSAGVYEVSAGGDFTSLFVVPASSIGSTAPISASVSDSSSRTGYRLGAEAGVRYVVNPSTWISVIGSLDYFSEMPTAVLPRETGDPAAHIAFDDLLEWRTGVRLTFATN